jgi:hypothetical protein
MTTNENWLRVRCHCGALLKIKYVTADHTGLEVQIAAECEQCEDARALDAKNEP